MASRVGRPDVHRSSGLFENASPLLEVCHLNVVRQGHAVALDGGYRLAVEGKPRSDAEVERNPGFHLGPVLSRRRPDTFTRLKRGLAVHLRTVVEIGRAS